MQLCDLSYRGPTGHEVRGMINHIATVTEVYSHGGLYMLVTVARVPMSPFALPFRGASVEKGC